MHTLNDEWVRTYCKVMDDGRLVNPRGRRTLEIGHHAVAVNMCHPVLTVPERKLGYKFMAAEALWMVQGRRDVFHERMARFSDDGLTLAGAYGPRIARQVRWIVDRLVNDRETRQAALTVWEENPAPSRDIPCTMSMVFSIRANLLDLHVFMRSSDVWLGLPYDVFSFAMVANMAAVVYNDVFCAPGVFPPVTVGTLYLTAASTHLYEENWNVRITRPDAPARGAPVFTSLRELTDTLNLLSISKRGDALRWWE